MAFSVSLAGGSVDEDEEEDEGGDGVMKSAERKSSSSIKSSSSCEPPCSWTPAALRCLAGRGRITSWLPIVPSYLCFVFSHKKNEGRKERFFFSSGIHNGHHTQPHTKLFTSAAFFLTRITLRCEYKLENGRER